MWCTERWRVQLRGYAVLWRERSLHCWNASSPTLQDLVAESSIIVKPRVLVTPIELVRKHEPAQEVLLAAGLEIVYPPVGIHLYDEDRLIAHLLGIDAMLAGMEPLSARVLAQSNLKTIARFGVGYDAIDIPTANRARHCRDDHARHQPGFGRRAYHGVGPRRYAWLSRSRCHGARWQLETAAAGTVAR